MEREIYRLMAEVEDRHWWFASRRVITDSVMDRLALPANARILEAGCGTGGNLPMLARRGTVYAMELDDEARSIAGARGMAKIEPGRLPDMIPFGDLRFDLILMTDVLEHVDDDAGTLRALRARLQPGGFLVLTVPALQWLWSEHDVSHHHRRRYSSRHLRGLVVAAGYSVDFLSYFNSVLFPAIAAVRIIQRLTGISGDNDDLRMPPQPLNRTLTKLFSSERHLLERVSLPVGVSLLAVGRNPRAAAGDGAINGPIAADRYRDAINGNR
jgi:SAM-dependent methyltransferase